MTITPTRWAQWNIFALVLVFSAHLLAQTKPATGSPSLFSPTRDLNSTLAELMRTVPATDQDLANLQQPGKLRKVTFWRGENTHEVQMTAAALRRNLQFAVPNLIHDVETSGGSITTTFKLYNDLAVVCESLDSLIPPGSRERKNGLTGLSKDASDMNRLKGALSSYIQQTAAAMENKNAQFVSSAGQSPKRVIVDDNIPDKPSPRKRRPTNQ